MNLEDLKAVFRAIVEQVPQAFVTIEWEMSEGAYRLLWNTRTPTQRKLARMVGTGPKVKHNVRHR